jgi:Cd2+/Zn2+-exporting ATPase
MDIQTGLNALGLTEYEAKVYLALLKDYPANGYQISKRTGVPRSMVYEALGRLHNRGAVMKSGEERAVIYRPLPPEQLLERYDREHRRLIDDLRSGLISAYDVKPEDSLWTVSGRDSVFAYASQMLSSSQNEAYLVLNDFALEQLRDEIVAVCGRGLRVGILLTGSGDLDCEQVYYHPRAESELQGLDDMLVVVADNHECLIADLSPDALATITKNMNLVLITRQFVWMELFAQRINKQLNPAQIKGLDEADRRILQNFSNRG